MRRIFALTLSALTLLCALGGCKSPAQKEPLTAQARTQLYKTAIENARDSETNDYMGIITSADDEQASLIFLLLGLSEEDMTSYALSVSPVNVRAYAIAAVLPADDPEILVYVMLDDPNNARTDYSSILAAPVVGNIISEIAPYLGIATDGVDRSGTTVKVPNLTGKEWSNAQVQLNIKGLKHHLAESESDQTAALVTYQYPRAGAEVPYGTTVYLYTDTYEGSHTDVPDVTGKSADFARQMLSAAGLNCVVEGNTGGTVQAQSEEPGSSVQRGTIVTITCG